MEVEYTGLLVVRTTTDAVSLGMPVVAVLAALDEEIQAFQGEYDLEPLPAEDPFVAFRFQVGDVKVVLTRTGVGKVFAAMVAQRVIDRMRPDYLIVTGIAGSVREGLNLGDVVVSRDCVQHDLDATSLGFEIGQVPYTEYRILRAEPRLVKLALRVPVKGQRVVAGRILTGDQFVNGSNESLRCRLRDLEGSVIEMEGAAIALVATVNRVPFVIIRSVSDKADAVASVDFGAFLRCAASNSCTVCMGILKGVGALPMVG